MLPVSLHLIIGKGEMEVVLCEHRTVSSLLPLWKLLAPSSVVCEISAVGERSLHIHFRDRIAAALKVLVE